jgi:hypothetical protein
MEVDSLLLRRFVRTAPYLVKLTYSIVISKYRWVPGTSETCGWLTGFCCRRRLDGDSHAAPVRRREMRQQAMRPIAGLAAAVYRQNRYLIWPVLRQPDVAGVRT